MAPLSVFCFLATLSVAMARALWSTQPALQSDLLRQAYPVGNGRLGAMPYGAPGAEKVNLNIDSLWSGGPFEADNYTGGNPTSQKYTSLPGIRDEIFRNGTGSNLSVSIADVSTPEAYKRSLNLEDGVHTTTFTANGSSYTSKVYCSFPDQVCVYDLSATKTLPQVIIKLENELVDSSLQSISGASGYVRMTGVTQLGPPVGMKYDSIARIVTKTNSSYNNATGSLLVPANANLKTLTIVVGAGTNYDQTNGNAASNFSFKGQDPKQHVEAITTKAASKSSRTLLAAHTADYQALASQFSLRLPDAAHSADLETSALFARYSANGTGDPLLEATLFDYGRHLFISSSRENSLPPNLQGNWATDLYAAWSGDYHANINLQMNHWGAVETGLGSLQAPLWNYMANNWVPRGQQTAQLLYGSDPKSGAWVVHDEINIFGHTGMKEEAQWANYPASAAWMMQHVYDNWDYSQDDAWLARQGYPLIKGVAEFWLSQLQEDEYFKDGSLVVNPCNSPEHGPTTFACTHYQQLIHQVFVTFLQTSSHVPNPDTKLQSSIHAALLRLDKGLHIGSWGEIKEWKLPDSFGYDVQNDTHRHLSNLIGWYPGFSITSYANGLQNETIKNAVATTLYSRGMGSGPDADAGWEKVWRGACWARLGNAQKAYDELKFAVSENFADNGFSMYSGHNLPFQIDANFGLVGYVLAMLVTDVPQGLNDTKQRSVILGPAIPTSWGGGSVKGLRLRGDGQVAFAWNADGLVTEASLSGRNAPIVVVDRNGRFLCQR